MLEIVGFSGSPRRPSKTLSLVREAVEAIRSAVPGRASVFDLLDLGPSLGAASSLADLDGDARLAMDAILRADILVAGSPVYKASYAGLFKHLFDLLPPEALAGKIVCLTATGGSERHALVIEQHMRPLFSFFCAVTLPTVIFATDADFDKGALRSANVRTRLAAAAREAQRLSGRPARQPAEPAVLPIKGERPASAA